MEWLLYYKFTYLVKEVKSKTAISLCLSSYEIYKKGGVADFKGRLHDFWKIDMFLGAFSVGICAISNLEQRPYKNV